MAIKKESSKILTSFKDVKGKKFKVIRSEISHHNYPVGSIFTFKRNSPSHQGNDMAVEFTGNTINVCEVELVEPQTRAEIEAEIKEIKKEYKAKLEELESTLEYLKETGAEIADNDEIKVYKALKALNSTSSDYEKARVIASIINK